MFFIFDPDRKAVLLISGDKRNQKKYFHLIDYPRQRTMLAMKS
ncbi:MAG: hypothetical protein KDK41_08845 [Leptospiraceae bacterium]|nr:hypothetical protein [Leptospiraceae bacterium]MCB1200739.1 hypothetical protein [Leptospiraceae bacterium]